MCLGKFWSQNLQGRGQVTDLGVNGRVTLKWEDTDWIHLAREMNHWQGLADRVVKIPVLWKKGYLSTSWATDSFSRKILLMEVSQRYRWLKTARHYISSEYVFLVDSAFSIYVFVSDPKHKPDTLVTLLQTFAHFQCFCFCSHTNMPSNFPFSIVC